jgi:hypothetical protein
VRALSSAGVTQPPRSYDLSESPPSRPPNESVRDCAPPDRGFPHSPRPPSPHAVPTTPVDRTGAFVGFFPARTAFPSTEAGRRPRFYFRGLLGLHACYGLRGCSAT